MSRAGGTVTFPAAFLLVAAMNPCPCGEGVYEGACRCSVVARARYRRRLSAPLLDRFDLVVALSRPDPDDLLSVTPGEPSAAVAARVAAARARAAAAAGSACPLRLAADAEALLAAKLRAGDLSARGLHKVTRVAQTVADIGRGRRGDVRARLRGARPPWWPGGRRDMTSPVVPEPDPQPGSALPEEAYAIALASTPSVGPSTLRTALASEPPSAAWARSQRRSGISAGDAASVGTSRGTLAGTSATWDHGALGGRPEVPDPTG